MKTLYYNVYCIEGDEARHLQDLFAHNLISIDEIIKRYENAFYIHEYPEDISAYFKHYTTDKKYVILFDEYEDFIDIYKCI